MNKVAAIVVTFNRCELLKECLYALRQQTYHDFDVLVIDNASTDKTKMVVKDASELTNRIKYYNTGLNLGGAGGFNYGLKKAYEAGYELFWLMDDDTIPENESLGSLMKADKLLKGNYGYLSSYAKWSDGSPCKMNIPEFEEKQRAFNLCVQKFSQNQIVKIRCATFVSFFTRRECIDKVGFPITDFFIWGDDTNYCLRLNKYKQGYFVPNSIVIHKMKTNTGTSISNDPGDRLERYYYAFRNRFVNAKLRRNVLMYFLSVIKQTILIIIISPNRKKERLAYMYKGVFMGLWFNPVIEYPNNTGV